MPTLVHLADERKAKKILSSGLKIGKDRSGVFCMPVLPSYYITHQWLRELKRRGVRTFVGVYFKIDSSELILAGRYNEPHRHITIGQAIKEIMDLEDPLGYEIIIDRKIKPNEITGIKSLPQTIGWRYKPGSNGIRPCACSYCIKSTIKARSIRERYEPPDKSDNYQTLLKKIKEATKSEEVEDLLYNMQGKKRRSDPAELFFLLDKYDFFVNRVLADTLGYFKHPNTESLLIKLLGHADPYVRDYSAESIMKLKGKAGLDILEKFYADPMISEVIQEHNSRY